MGGQGGTVVLSTHFVGSGPAHASHSFSSHCLHGGGRGHDDRGTRGSDPAFDPELHPHGIGLLHFGHVDACAAALQPQAFFDLLHLLQPHAGGVDDGPLSDTLRP